MHPQKNKVPENAIAVIGMDCRFPGANDTRQFWKNLVSGTESITFFTDDELRGAGIHPETIADLTYVRAAGIMEDAELFDAAFFGYTPTEAICIDPQQCQFLQTSGTPWRMPVTIPIPIPAPSPSSAARA